MKKSILIIGAVAAVSLVSCKKAETTEMENVDSTATAVVVDNDSVPITNNPTVDSVDDAAERALDNAGDAVKEGPAEVQDAAKDATDGDGNVRK
ncbi:hypothetical protein EIH07_00250 [Chryseobacterium taklimakanense]|uniref:hypothetical protein n=1 Tax=Chryseobacterium taklimakanense TaxID=536441 RepID=UPI000F603AAD|nr:hypothetical protein [Chryseobacterium taklimakanense]AZI21577.1 hypothetical protein EIH07_00250 [Chryseobacterium taklimakanense]